MQESLKLAELKGYLTAKVDEYDKAQEFNPDCRISAKRVSDDFDRLLEIVIDMQGRSEDESPIRCLRKRIVELEESCRNFGEVENNLHKKIREQEEEIKYYRHKIQLMQDVLDKRLLENLEENR